MNKDRFFKASALFLSSSNSLNCAVIISPKIKTESSRPDLQPSREVIPPLLAHPELNTFDWSQLRSTSQAIHVWQIFDSSTMQKERKDHGY